MNVLMSLLLRLQNLYYCHADFGENVTVNEVGAQEVVGGFLGLILWAIQIMGGGVIIWGGVEIAQTLNEPNGDKRQNAIMKCIGGAIMLGIGTYLKQKGIIA